MGDDFLRDLFRLQQSDKLTAGKNKKILNPYMEDYFNVSTYFKAATAGNTLTRLVNSLIDAVNERDHLPKILIFITDCDLLQDMCVYDLGILESIKEATRWLIRQISIII